MGNKDLEMEVKQPDKDSPASPDEADKPPEPPKRDNKSEIPPEMVSEPKPKRRTIGSFPRPEVIYKPEKSESCMTCLRNTLVIINIIIWVSRAFYSFVCSFLDVVLVEFAFNRSSVAQVGTISYSTN